MADAQLEHSGDRTYFTDATGIPWRVHDVAFGPPSAKPRHFRRLRIGDLRATSRVFVSAAGERRSYRFEKGESRALSAQLCDVQLASGLSIWSEIRCKQLYRSK
jgi:hypothetical protein